jgi:hypothetical protein
VLDLSRNNIAACQIHKRRPDYFFTPEFDSGLVVFSEGARPTVRLSIEKVLSTCAPGAFLAFLPENSVPTSDIGYLQELAVKLNLTIIAGLEHTVTWLSSTAVDEYDFQRGAYTAENRFVVVRPDRRVPEYGKKNFPARVKGHSVVEQIERNSDPQFFYFPVPTPDGSEMNVWPILCSDFLEIASDRFWEELESNIRTEQIDLIAVLSHTPRSDAFRTTIRRLIAGDTRRPLPTNILYTNFARYGGSFCLAYDERESLRGSENLDFWSKRIVPVDEESFRLFVNWASALQSVRTERARAAP